jgi:hypothetical protein
MKRGRERRRRRKREEEEREEENNNNNNNETCQNFEILESGDAINIRNGQVIVEGDGADVGHHGGQESVLTQITAASQGTRNCGAQ